MPVLPPTPEQAAEKSLRTARGLGMGAAITGLVSVIIQGIAPLGILLPLGASDSWSVEDVLIWLMAALLSIMLVPLIVIVIWATCFGLSLAACIVANTRRSTPLPARWAGIGGVTGGVLAASIFQGAPLTIIILTAANEGATGDSGPAAATAAILVAVVLFFVHVVLISKLRTLGSGVGPGAAAPGRPGFTPAPPGPHRDGPARPRLARAPQEAPRGPGPAHAHGPARRPAGAPDGAGPATPAAASPSAAGAPALRCGHPTSLNPVP